MNIKNKNKIIFVSIVLAFIVLVYFLSRRSTLDDCYKLPTDTAVQVCVSNYYQNNNKIIPVSPSTQPSLLEDLNDISLSEGDISIGENSIGQNTCTFSGVITNNSNVDTKNIKVHIKFYNPGDDINKFEPISQSEVTLKNEVRVGKSARFSELMLFEPCKGKLIWQIVYAEKIK